MNISDLKKLTKENISDLDPLFVQDISDLETKLLISSDLSKYILSSSNLINSLKSGSFTGSFYNNLIGKITNVSSTFLSQYSNNTNYLNYPNNSTSSYSLISLSSSISDNSLRSITSSFALSSSNSITSSYANVEIIQNSITSSFSIRSIISDYANSSNYLVYNGQNNGKVYKSIISEYSPTSSIAISLIPNSISNEDSIFGNNIQINDSKAFKSLISSISTNAETASYIKLVDNSQHSSFAINTDLIPFAYINFLVTHNNGTDWKFKVNQYKNIANPGIGLASPLSVTSSIAIFTGSYFVSPTSIDPNKPPSATILSEASFNFPTGPFINYWFNTFSFPLSNDKFAICIQLRMGPEEDISNILLNLLNGTTVSAVIYSNVTGKTSPESVITASALNAGLLEGCAKL